MAQLLDTAMRYASDGFSRFHMPGHKGRALPYTGFGQISALDLTEIAGMDSLYAAEGAIRHTEVGYAKLYGSADCFLSAGGATLCIQAMLALALNPGEKLLICRGAHVSAVNAMALLDLHPEWILPKPDPSTGLSKAITPQQVEQGFLAHPDAKAVYITSPTYFGAIADIHAIAQFCKARGIPLLVDNAHGAHLAFFSPNLHPIALGADLCCDSLHKTLPVLTGGAILHLGDERYADRARQKLSLFGSTSPSYLVLCSMDGALNYLTSGKAAGEMRTTAERLGQVAQRARNCGYLLTHESGDPLRLTLSAAPLGYTGSELAQHLRENLVEPEYAGDGYLVLMASPFNTSEDLARLENALASLLARQPISLPAPASILPKRVLPLREAVFAESEILPVENAQGRIASALAAHCPPGIALACAGELIDNQLAQILKNYGISHISVVK